MTEVDDGIVYRERVADPTVLTTAQTQREVSALKELVFNRLASMEKAIEVSHADLVRVPTEVQERVGNLKELHETKIASARADSVNLHDNIAVQLVEREKLVLEKFASIQTQFLERDVRTEQNARDSKVAVDAALQAAKEAVAEQNRSSALAIAKSETATMKQIDQIGTLIQTGNKAVDDKFDDVKERLSKIEGQSTGRKDFFGWIVAGISVLATIVLLADKFAAR